MELQRSYRMKRGEKEPYGFSIQAFIQEKPENEMLSLPVGRAHKSIPDSTESNPQLDTLTLDTGSLFLLDYQTAAL